jgi:COP9 signalosome complex subunit 4
MNIDQALASVSAIADHKVKIDKYQELLRQLFTKQAGGDLQSFVSHMADEKTPLVVSRALLQAFVQQLVKAGGEGMSVGVQKTLSEGAVQRLSPRASHFEDTLAALREHLSSLYDAAGDAKSAAEQLLAIPLDNSARAQDNEYRARIHVRVSQLALRAGDLAMAATGVSRAGEAIFSLGEAAPPALLSAHKLCSAELLDRQAEFIRAAIRYYDVSTAAATGEKERTIALNAAIHCTLLAEAGPERSRILVTLFKDERTARLDTFEVLRKVCLDRMLTAEEVAWLAARLNASHAAGGNAARADALSRSIVQHNLLSASRVYDNIGFEELGRLLGISKEEAERVAARMIAEQRLTGSIDQIGGFVFFESASKDPLLLWDAQIERVCLLLNSVLEKVSAKFPQFVEA